MSREKHRPHHGELDFMDLSALEPGLQMRVIGGPHEGPATVYLHQPIPGLQAWLCMRDWGGKGQAIGVWNRHLETDDESFGFKRFRHIRQ